MNDTWKKLKKEFIQLNFLEVEYSDGRKEYVKIPWEQMKPVWEWITKNFDPKDIVLK